MGDKSLESSIAMMFLMTRQLTLQTKQVKEQKRDHLFARLTASLLRAYQTHKVTVLSRGFLRLQQVQVQLKCSKTSSLGMGYGSWRSGCLKIKGVSYCFPNCSGEESHLQHALFNLETNGRHEGVLLTNKRLLSFVNGEILPTKLSFTLSWLFFILHKCGRHEQWDH